MKIVTKNGTVYECVTEISCELNPADMRPRMVFGTNAICPWEIASITDTDTAFKQWLEKKVVNEDLQKSNAHLKACLDAAIARNEQLRRDLAEVQRRNDELIQSIANRQSYTQRFEITVKPV